MTPFRYASTRTLGVFRMDISAWIQGFTFPAGMFLGAAGKGGSEKKMNAPRSSPGGLPSWYRQKPGYKYHMFDLGPEQHEATQGRGDAELWNRNTQTLVNMFAGHSSRFGGHGIRKTPAYTEFGGVTG